MAPRKKWKNPSGTVTYFAWRGMRHRCNNPKNASWENYGGRGITVCDKWAHDYDAFFEDMGPCPEGLSLDRIDVNESYSLENCRWVGWDVQSTNKRVNVHITHNGETKTVSQWADHLGIGNDTLWRRLNVYKMDAEKALTSKSLVPAASRACGTRSGYDGGCKCTACLAFNAKRARDRKLKIAVWVDGCGYLACGGEIATEQA